MAAKRAHQPAPAPLALSQQAGWRLPEVPAAAAAGATTPPPKQARSGEALDAASDAAMSQAQELPSDMKDMIELMARATLQNMSINRQLVASCWTTFLVPQSSALAQAAAAAGRRYNAAVQAGGRDHRFGPPHPHIALAVLEAGGELEVVGPEHRNLLRVTSRVFSESPQSMVAQAFPYFVATECYFKEGMEGEPMTRLQFSIDPLYSFAEASLPMKGIVMATALKEALAAAMLATKGVRKEGSAPRGNVERQLSRQLTSSQRSGTRSGDAGAGRGRGRRGRGRGRGNTADS